MVRPGSQTGLVSTLDLIEGFYLAHALGALERAGVLKSLEKWVSADRLANRHGLGIKILDAALQMLATRTSLIAHRSGRYRITKHYNSQARFMLLQYLGAYGRHAAELGRILHHPTLGRSFINHREHARAFSQDGLTTQSILADLLLQLGLNHALDIGCGTGALLLNLAVRNRHFEGWGVDINRWMCAAARRQAASLRPRKRIEFLQGDCRELGRWLSRSVIERVRTITAASVINEFFADGISEAVDWLATIRTLFPGRTMLIADYYGQLGTAKMDGSREIMLHDFVQVLSGQCIPPPTLSAWRRIYRKAGCGFVHAVEIQDSAFFVHILRL